MADMNGSLSDPRESVVEPVRGALAWLILRGAGSFTVAILAVLTTAVDLHGTLHQVGHWLLPSILAGVVFARMLHVLLTHDRPDGAGAWGRAREVDAFDTTVAAGMTVIVPIAWLAGLAAILLHHIDDPGMRDAIVSLYGPWILMLWAAATIAWVGDCRERLGRGLAESDRRFRSYWADVGRPSS